jgi:hypothetical protein
MAGKENNPNIVDTNYYAVVVTSEDTFARSVPAADKEFYLVIHHAALESLLNVIAPVVVAQQAQAAPTPAGETPEEAAIRVQAAKDALRAAVVEKLFADGVSMTTSGYGGAASTLGTKDILIYDPIKIFKQIVDENKQPKPLSTLIRGLVDDHDLFKFLMEIGKMAG